MPSSTGYATGMEIPSGPLAYQSPAPGHDFYDEHFDPGAYLETHAAHMARWHGQ